MSCEPQTLGARLWHQHFCPLHQTASAPMRCRHCGGAYIAARFLRAGSTGESIVSATMLMLSVSITHAIAREASRAGGLQQPQATAESAAAWEESIVQIALDAGNSIGLPDAAAGLLEALLWRDTPELQLEAGRIKADMERLKLRQAATAAQASRDETVRVRATRLLACMLLCCCSVLLLVVGWLLACWLATELFLCMSRDLGGWTS